MFRGVRRFKQALSHEECVEILQNEVRGVLSVLGDDDYPYGMPMDYLYNPNDGKIYFHSGPGGHREDAIKKHDKVSLCVYDSGYRKEGDWALNIKSVIVFGRISIVEDKELALNSIRALSHKFTSDDEYIEADIKRTGGVVVCLCITPEHITGKLVNES